jgi:hypothetical protein
MDTMITKERKDEIILSLRKFIVDNDDKVALYDEIYHHMYLLDKIQRETSKPKTQFHNG